MYLYEPVKGQATKVRESSKIADQNLDRKRLLTVRSCRPQGKRERQFRVDSRQLAKPYISNPCMSVVGRTLSVHLSLGPSRRTIRDSLPEYAPGTVIDFTLLTHITAGRSRAGCPSRAMAWPSRERPERWCTPGRRGRFLDTIPGPTPTRRGDAGSCVFRWVQRAKKKKEKPQLRTHSDSSISFFSLNFAQ